MMLDLCMADLTANNDPSLDGLRNKVFTWKANFQSLINLYYEDLKKGKLG